MLVIGGGTGAATAAIQSARMGVPTIIASEHGWLGGMVSSAGVSAIDGNHKLPSGIWNEFRDAIYKVYGGPNKVFTGWVSNTQFEPRIADSIFKAMANAEKQLQVQYHLTYKRILKKGNKVIGAVFTNNKQQTIH
ncbi:MAG TPA: FAD-dependent oxidoreductase, partial [Chitinophagaceae bacterium]|nr:FAD-dependent oxidoreductase [Chitinophagaceae bacterium]